MQSNTFTAPSSSAPTSSSGSSSPLGLFPLLAEEKNQHQTQINDIKNSTPPSTNEQLLTEILTLLAQDPSAVPPNVDLQTILAAVQMLKIQENLEQQNQRANSMVYSQGFPDVQSQAPLHQVQNYQNLPILPLTQYPRTNLPFSSSSLLTPQQYSFQIGPSGKKEFKPRNTRSGRQQAQYTHLIERTIYITELVHDITEADIANFFSRCGDVVDCRLVGDAHSRMRMAFVEFSQNTFYFAVPEALKLTNTMLRGNPIRVQKSKTAIIPISPKFLPQNEEEALRCQRTVCVKNVDKRFKMEDVRVFFETLAVDENTGADGKVERVKLVQDNSGPNSTQMAYVEFCRDESVACALNKCQGALMGCLPLRICASKVPIRTPEQERALRETTMSGAKY